MKLIVDMNLSGWVAALAGAGIDAAHWSTLGRANALDVEIMACAKANDCVVLTHNLDFGAILAATQGEKPSVVQGRAGDVTPEALGNQLVAALRHMEPELSQGALITVDSGRTRLRVLPLRLR